MRNGDAYRIKSLHETGVSVADICERFKNDYPAEEVKRFLPVSASDTQPKPKKARRRVAAKE